MSTIDSVLIFGPRYTRAAEVVEEHLVDRGEVSIYAARGTYWDTIISTSPSGQLIHRQQIFIRHADGSVIVRDVDRRVLARYELTASEIDKLYDAACDAQVYYDALERIEL
jgi:hypothetical protein